MKSFAFVFPGQGSQSVGMLDAWGDHPVVIQTLAEASDALAEDIGLISRIGRFVLQHACHEARNWPEHCKVAVNLSPAQFRNKSLAADVVAALDRSGLAPHRLELEITESALLDTTADTLAILHQLRTLGVKIAMDDFGTGFSSLSYLRSFPFDRIKIDRSFISEIASNRECQSIVRAVAALGQNLGMTTTAEGIETLEQLLLVRAQRRTTSSQTSRGRCAPVGLCGVVRTSTRVEGRSSFSSSCSVAGLTELPVPLACPSVSRIS